MSFLVVIAVAVAVFFYVRFTRQARQTWLAKLDLPGRWHAQADADGTDDTELTLNGRLDRGEFIRRSGATTWQGTWRLDGHTLRLTGADSQEVFDLHYFKAGNIGLEGDSGSRLILSKATDNVVSLRSHRRSDNQP